MLKPILGTNSGVEKKQNRLFRKRNLLWFLPLLLLLQWKGEVYVKTLNGNTGEEMYHVPVKMLYHEAFLFEKGRFFTNDSMVKFTKQNPLSGSGVIKEVRYSLYSWIFHFFSDAVWMAGDSCYYGGTERQRFHNLPFVDTVFITLRPKLNGTFFKLVNKHDQLPLPGAKMIIQTELFGQHRTDTLAAGSDGKIYLDSLFHCGKLIQAIASFPGYASDSIMNRDISGLMGYNISAPYTIELTPVKSIPETKKIQNKIPQISLTRKIKFFNTDEETRLALGGVVNEVRIENGNNCRSVSLVSNEKGEFSIDVKSGDRISVNSSAEFYKENNYSIDHKEADRLWKGADSLRTIPLKSIWKNLCFHVVDFSSKELLPDSKIYFFEDGQFFTDRITEHGEGIFSVKAKENSSISVYAEHTGYLPNESTVHILNVDSLSKTISGKMDIPMLKPKRIVHRTYDPCSFPQYASSGNAIQTFEINPGVRGFRIEYDFMGKKDKMIIYSGISTKGLRIAEFEAFVNEVTPPYIDLADCHSRFITVQMIANIGDKRGDSSTSSWMYKFVCE